MGKFIVGTEIGGTFTDVIGIETGEQTALEKFPQPHPPISMG